jgi:cytochrome P450
VSRALLTWGNLSDEEQLPHAANMVDYWRYCRALVASRHAEASDDLPGDLVRLQREGAEISDDQIAGVLYSVLFAGHETTTTLMANGARELLLHRANWEALVAEPARIPAAVEEVLRYSPSIVAWRRKALKDAEIGGVAVPEGANILLVMGSTRPPSRRPTASTSAARTRAAISRSATASISVSARSSPSWSSPSRWRS